jgi:hypothetical protein
MQRKVRQVFRVLAMLAPSVCSADLFTFSGFVNSPANTALIGSAAWAGSTPPAPDFTDDFAIANNVAIYGLTVLTAGNVNFLSKGFAAGGVDPYFTLFSGFGDTATFLGSNFAQAFTTGGDFNLDFALGAGDYTIALGVFANMSFAENLGVGDLGDGFTGLGGPSFLGNYYYELDVTTGGTAVVVPEPSHLLAAAVAGFLILYRKRLRKTAQ